MKYYLLTFNEDWADEHYVPALEVMDEKQIEMATHALGLSDGRTEPYRNHYCVGKDNKDYQKWEDLVARGFATKRNMGPEWCGDMFYLTEKGKEYIIAQLLNTK